MLSRRRFARQLATGAITGVSGFAVQSGPNNQPDLVVALCDDMGYGDLGCYGHPQIQTPNLDAFARQGVRFLDGYAASPVCSPSRAGLLTGRTPVRAGVCDWIPEGSPVHLAREEQTFAKLLQQVGYQTAHIGKWHLNGKFNSPDQPQPGDHGFAEWFSTQNNALASHRDPFNFVRNGQAVGTRKGTSSQIIVDEAIEFLKRSRRDQPICLFLCFHAPHENVASADEFHQRYLTKAKNPDQAQYFANIEELDFHFGRFLRSLDAYGRGNAMVLFTSDNGPETLHRYPGAFRSYGTAGNLRAQKLSLYEGGIRVPMLLRWPGKAAEGLTTTEPVSTLDLLPTLAEAGQVPHEKVPLARTLDGASWLPMLNGGTLKRQTPLHWHYYHSIDGTRAALRDGEWKIVGRWGPNAPTFKTAGFKPEEQAVIRGYGLENYELYHLISDPGEKQDLAGREKGRLRRLRNQLRRLDDQVRMEMRTWPTGQAAG